MKRFYALTLLVTTVVNTVTIFKTDAQAYEYCKHEYRSYIAIIWPLAQGKSEQIEQIMNYWGMILYQKKWLFTPNTAYTILKQAHYNVVPSQQPHCSSMKEHVDWYFPHNRVYLKPARIMVIYFENDGDVLSCKYAIRKLFKGLQYRSIHINDTHQETMELAHFFLTL